MLDEFLCTDCATNTASVVMSRIPASASTARCERGDDENAASAASDSSESPDRTSLSTSPSCERQPIVVARPARKVRSTSPSPSRSRGKRRSKVSAKPSVPAPSKRSAATEQKEQQLVSQPPKK